MEQHSSRQLARSALEKWGGGCTIPDPSRKPKKAALERQLYNHPSCLLSLYSHRRPPHSKAALERSERGWKKKVVHKLSPDHHRDWKVETSTPHTANKYHRLGCPAHPGPISVLGADWKSSSLEALPSLAEEGLTSPHCNYLSYKIQALNFIKPIKTAGPGRGASRSPSALGDYGSRLQGQSSYLTVLFLLGSTIKSPHLQPPTKLLPADATEGTKAKPREGLAG